MFNPATTMIHHCVEQLQAGYRQTYGDSTPEYEAVIGQVATIALTTIAHTDALYHNIEHTILVTLVGQEILRGKQLLDGNISCDDWLQFILSLLCHDIGYIKGICRQDSVEQHTYTTGVNGEMIAIAPGATDASLTPYHVDRGKQFVVENFAEQPLFNLAAIQQNIELTRFPVPNDQVHQDTTDYPGLARAADLIGQLSDPRYLEKIPALFYEFEEVGTNKALGYRHPGELRAGYPKFYRNVVMPYIQTALRYLEATPQGRQIVSHLQANVEIAEQEPSQATPSSSRLVPLALMQIATRVRQTWEMPHTTVTAFC